MVNSIFTQFRANALFELPMLFFDARPIANVALNVLGELIGPILDSSVDLISRKNTQATRKEHSERSHELSIKLAHLREIFFKLQTEQVNMVSQRNMHHIFIPKT